MDSRITGSDGHVHELSEWAVLLAAFGMGLAGTTAGLWLFRILGGTMRCAG